MLQTDFGGSLGKWGFGTLFSLMLVWKLYIISRLKYLWGQHLCCEGGIYYPHFRWTEHRVSGYYEIMESKESCFRR
jgi:hypothetical protein